MSGQRHDPGRRAVWAALKGVFATMGEVNIGLTAAGVAFFAMLALFPAMAAVIAIWSFIADPVVVEQQLAMLQRFVPGDAFDIIDAQTVKLVGATDTTLGWATLISLSAALWSARAGIAGLIMGLNMIYREKNRGGFRHYITAFGVTFLLIGVVIVALASVVIAPVVLKFLPLGPLAAAALSVVRWLTAIAVMVLGLGVVYRFGPNRRGARPGWLTPGAFLAVMIWGLASYAFSYYLSNFGRYNEIYGTLGAVVALLMWLYISAYVILLGALLNAELELRTKRDTTVGPANPPGFRGAYVADHYNRPD